MHFSVSVPTIFEITQKKVNHNTFTLFNEKNNYSISLDYILYTISWTKTNFR